jgi:hypothetical protein
MNSFEFFRIVLDFFDLKRLKNSQICIQTIKFKFKRTNQEITSRYHSPASATNGSTSGIARTIAPDPAPTQVLPHTPVRR